MVETGVTLVEALDCIAIQASKPNVKRLVEDLNSTVRGGNDLSSVLARQVQATGGFGSNAAGGEVRVEGA